MDPNMIVGGAPFVPFLGVTGLLAVLCWTSFLLSVNSSAGTPVFEDHVQQVEDVKAKEAATVKLQAALRAKSVRDEEKMRKRRSSIGSAEI